MKTKHTNITYLELAHVYIKVGTNAFGGWSTTYVLLEKEFTSKRRLLSRDQLQTAAASGQALPGPAQVIVAAQTSYFLKGVAGSVMATLCYLLPSIILTISFGYLYFNYLADSVFSSRLIGVQAAVAGIVIGNAYKIARQNATNAVLWLVVSLSALVSYVLKVPVLIIIFGFGAASLLISITRSKSRSA